MIEYMASRIIEGKLTYQKVMTKFSANKAEIDAILEREGYAHLIEEIQVAATMKRSKTVKAKG